MLVLDDEKQVKEELASVRQNRDHVQELLTRVEKTVAPGRERELFDAIVAARAAYLPHEDEFLKHADKGDYSTAKDVLLKSARPAQLKLQEAMETFDQYRCR
ncbi:hypothetical protein HK414_18530 [Ramlibacter terrae]|uniref:Chemotaxis methyl-accepting receptor HlyB-like 4HB MCP domain-containing protein n=1 Tax=Ramlibacter terrae TaxID=2732511 RepID=A0ABX6P4A4_9BURK|nr:hypothetical protein HK414_18530 [Ramlibacter terrae]